MYVYMYVYNYVCMYVCMYVCTYVCIYIFMYNLCYLYGISHRYNFMSFWLDFLEFMNPNCMYDLWYNDLKWYNLVISFSLDFLEFKNYVWRNLIRFITKLFLSFIVDLIHQIMQLPEVHNMYSCTFAGMHAHTSLGVI